MFSEIESILSKKLGKTQFIVYYTLDKNDYIVCFKSENYKIIIQAINYLYNKLKEKGKSIIYSYTNLIVKYDLINNRNSKCLKSSENVEKIDSICIKTILNNVNVEWSSILSKIKSENVDLNPIITKIESKNIELNSIIAKIKFFCELLSNIFYGNEAEAKRQAKEIVGYEILGDNDCRFIARNVPLNTLLGLFSKNGFLNNKNQLFSHFFVSSMTSLNVDTQNDSDCMINSYGCQIFRNESLSNRSELAELETKLSKKDSRYVHLITLLYQTYDYISSISYQTSKYEFDSLKKPFDLLLRLVTTSLDKYDDQHHPVDELYEYLSNMYTNIQENMRTDIRFYGLSDFSIMSYYSPTKLRVFYSSVVNKISEYYKCMSKKDTSIDYQFLIFLTNTPNTHVEQLWTSEFDEDKIMVVRVSEIDFYEVNDLVFQLAHEAAHFVGNDEIRNREFRFYQMVNFLITQSYQEIKKDLINSLINEDKSNSVNINDILKSVLINKPFSNFLAKQEQTISNRTTEFAKRMMQEGNLQKTEHFYYRNKVRTIIGDFLYLDTFIQRLIQEYFNELAEDIKIKLMGMLSRHELSLKTIKNIISNLKKPLDSLHDFINDYYQRMFIGDECDFIYLDNLMYETYADLSAVLLFDLRAESFCKIIRKRLDLNDSTYCDDILFVRMCIVIKAMANLSSKYNFINNSYKMLLEKDFQQLNQKKDKEWYENIFTLCNALENKEYCNHYVYQYILRCLSSQCKKLNRQKREEIIKIYSSTDDHNILQIVKYINKFLSGEI